MRAASRVPGALLCALAALPMAAAAQDLLIRNARVHTVNENDQYYFTVYNTAEAQDELLSNFNLAISRISLAQRTGYAYGIYRFRGRRYVRTDPDEYFTERVFGGYFALNYPLSKFERLETMISLSNSNKDADLRIEDRKALLLSNSITFAHDNSLWGPTGPLDGNRFSLTLAYTSDIQYSNVNYFSVIADYRAYLRVAATAAFASRFWIFYNDGRESRRFVMGGSWDLPAWRSSHISRRSNSASS